MKWPETIHEAFNLGTERIRDEEVERIRQAVEYNRIRVESHLINQANVRGISLGDVRDVVRMGDAVSKDLEHNVMGRQPGINFEGIGRSEFPIRVKVSWDSGYYVIVTTHRIGSEE